VTDQAAEYFFSYSRKDSPFVLRLANELRARGASVWVDQLDIVAGERWDEAVERALQSCPALVLVLSPEAVGSQNLMDEVSYALEKHKRILPVLYRECEIPFRLRRVQHVDFTGDYETGFRHLCRVLGLASSTRDDAMHPPVAVREAERLPESDAQRRAIEAETVAAWRLAVVAAGLALLYLFALSETCFNPDWVLLSALVGLPLALFIRWRNPRNFLWLLIPAITVLIGLPYGHAYGSMSRSPLFALEVGERCQAIAGTYAILLGLLVAVAMLDHSVIRLAYRPRRSE
jgi:hypothetical protein